MIKTLSYAVTGQRIEVAETAMLVAGTVNVYTASFAFDETWDGLQRTAVFASSDNTTSITREQLLTDDACTVPREVLVDGYYLRVGVYGTKADGTRLPTIWTERRLYINPGAGPSQEAAEPSPTLVEQLMGRMGDLSALKTEDKSSLVAAINEVWASGGGSGASVTDAAINEAGHLIITLSTGKEIDAGYAVGSDGDNGKSAYQYAVDGGYTGTEAEFAAKMAAEIPAVDTTLTKSGEAADAAVVGERLSSLSEEIANKTGGDGLSENVKETLLLLFNNLEYTADMSSTVNRLSQLFSGEIVKFSVTNNLTNLTTNNQSAEVEEGTGYTATLATSEGFAISKITITMGGEDVTASVYKDGVINIVSVSGDIVITATAAEAVSLEPVYAVSELAFDGATAVDTGYNLFDEDKDWTVVITWSFASGCNNSATVWSSDLADFTADTQAVRLARFNGWYWRICIGGRYINDYTGTDPNMKYIITKAKGASAVTVYSVVDGTKKETEQTNASVLTAFGKHNNVILGYSETVPYYFTGTINDFKIYNRVLDDTEINAYLGV